MKKSKMIMVAAMLVSVVTMEAKTSHAQTVATTNRVSAESIRPFKVHVEQQELDDLIRRVKATKWADKETVGDISEGVPLKTLQSLAKYWGSGYDWRKAEAKLNAFPQFMTTIDEVDIHFIHVRSKEKNALPIILTHGWPGSVFEFLKVIDPLVNPTAYGGKPEDAFDVIIPSMPGYGFSGKPTTTGWGPEHIASAWITLMDRLGYKKYVAQGGDWGAIITDQMALQAPKALIGIHTNMPGAVPADIDKATHAGTPAPAGLSVDEQKAYDQLTFLYNHVYYAYYMHSRPQSLAGLADSPTGLAAFLLDHDARSLELISRVFEGKKEGLTKDDILDNISLYWLTNTGVSAARLYKENNLDYFSPKGVKIPAAVSAFPDELYQAPKKWAEQAYSNLIYYNRPAVGGHFAAWEQPKIFSEELRASFQSLR
ncbi:epoxide hydrolase family protein [Chitinophaga sp. YR627]|uniref:epoxide hydrolase family protein n=1 Tax=Chitinophaga sp. YR627 TaxID=1881041 RepID=UPI000B7EC913|nr:epoxide hydrolase family protein [Chitinophaga sp. YR627]